MKMSNFSLNDWKSKYTLSTHSKIKKLLES
jgi:hypothetical protein